MLKRPLVLMQALATAGLFWAGPIVLSGCDSGSSTDGKSVTPTAEKQAELDKIQKETEAGIKAEKEKAKEKAK